LNGEYNMTDRPTPAEVFDAMLRTARELVTLLEQGDTSSDIYHAVNDLQALVQFNYCGGCDRVVKRESDGYVSVRDYDED